MPKIFYVFFFAFAFLVSPLSSFGENDSTSLFPTKINPEEHEIWKGDDPTAEQIKKMSQEELTERFTMKLIEDTRGLKFKKLVTSKELEEEKFILEYTGGKPLRGQPPMGFYRYKDQTLYINMASDPKKLEAIRIHETVHALQHQIWGNMATFTDEGWHILIATVEGEATFLPWLKYPKMKDKMSKVIPGWRKDRENLENYQGKAIGQEFGMFNYSIGANFINKVFESKGWEGVTALYKTKPALSTEQILHPEKYLEDNKWDEPTKFDFPNIISSMGPMWKYDKHAPGMTFNTKGEFEMIIRYLTNKHTGPKADEIAAGWDGDWFATFGDKKEACEVWLTAWDSNKDAMEWYEAEKQYFQYVLLPKYANKDDSKFEKVALPNEIKAVLKEYSEKDSEVFVYQYPGGYVYYEISGNLGLYIECTKIESMAKILKSFKGRKSLKEAKKLDNVNRISFINQAVKKDKDKPKNQRSGGMGGGQELWKQGFYLLGQGKFKEAKEKLEADSTPMGKMILEKLKLLMQAEELARQGQYDQARNIVTEIQKQGRYGKVSKYMLDKISQAEKDGAWPED